MKPNKKGRNKKLKIVGSIAVSLAVASIVAYNLKKKDETKETKTKEK